MWMEVGLKPVGRRTTDNPQNNRGRVNVWIRLVYSMRRLLAAVQK